MRRLGLLVITLAGALAVGACDGGGGGASPTPSAGPVTAPSATPGDGGGAATPSPAGSAAWTSGPLTVSHDVAVPPVPMLAGIRSAAHSAEGFDRIVFDFTGPLPGYTVRYVDEVREDPSDRPVSLPGRRYLQVVFTPAQAHTDAGAPTVTRTTQPLDYPMLRGYRVTGDFEGYVSVALGLDDQVGFRVGELPGRIYLDVAA
jgi:hypothetical protein